MNTRNNKQNQSERFKKTAEELGVDLDEAKLAETLRKIAKPDDTSRDMGYKDTPNEAERDGDTKRSDK